MPASQVKPEALAALPTSRPAAVGAPALGRQAAEGLRAATAAAQQKASRAVEVSSGDACRACCSAIAGCSLCTCICSTAKRCA